MKRILNFKFSIFNQFLMTKCFKHFKLNNLDLNRNFKLEIRNFSQGFTLIELIIYMALLSGFLIILTSVFGAILDTRLSTLAVSSVEQDGRFILARFAYDINRASSISVPSPSSLVLTINGQTYTYSVVSSNLQLVAPQGTDRLSGSGSTVSSLTIQRVGNLGGNEETFQIQFTLNSVVQNRGANEIRAFQTTIGRRIR
jgi:type II secretory pathway pseudopilin PulG